jgi:hypothetical protein
MYSASNTGAISNLAPIVRNVNYPVALPVRPEGIFANMPFSDTIFTGRKFGEFDYIAMHPKRVDEPSGFTVERLHDMAATYEKIGEYPAAQRFLYDAWQVSIHENSPVGNVLLAADLSRIEKRLGNDARSKYFLDEMYKSNRLDPAPESESSLQFLSDPKYYRPRPVE